MLNVGGDVAWRAAGSLGGRLCGISDPDDPGTLLGAVPLGADWSAAATSGTSERGEHIRRIDRLARIRQATVLAPDVVTADVLATAVVAGGEEQLLEASAREGVDVLAVTVTGEMLFTDGLARHLVRPAARDDSRVRHRLRAS
jgi:thiamine biosynthesis lipoprotein